MSSSTSFLQNTEIQYAPKKISAAKVFNIAYPVLLGFSFLYVIIMIFITPVDKYVSSSIGQVTSNVLGSVQKSLGTVSMFGLKDPTKPGAISRS